MTERLLATPDRIIEAARVFTAGGYEGSVEELLATQPASWPNRTERPMRAMRPVLRPVEATA